MPGEHVFVDETKEKTYIVAAAVVSVSDLNRLRTTMRALLLPRQSHLHFVREKNSRRGKILTKILECGVKIDIYDGVEEQRYSRWR